MEPVLTKFIASLSSCVPEYSFHVCYKILIVKYSRQLVQELKSLRIGFTKYAAVRSGSHSRGCDANGHSRCQLSLVLALEQRAILGTQLYLLL